MADPVPEGLDEVVAGNSDLAVVVAENAALKEQVDSLVKMKNTLRSKMEVLEKKADLTDTERERDTGPRCCHCHLMSPGAPGSGQTLSVTMLQHTWPEHSFGGNFSVYTLYSSSQLKET